MKKKKYAIRKGEGVLTAGMGFLFFVAISVVLVLNMRWLYEYDMQKLNLAEMTGYSEEVMLKNYDVLIAYNNVQSGMRELEFPDFPMSEQGRIHFQEVKQIFVVIQYGAMVTGVLFVLLLIRQLRRRNYKCLRLTALITLTVPALIGILAALFWDKVFVLFHQIVFRNDFWLFDPDTDPIIWILPDQYFFHCALAIVLFLLAASAVCAAGAIILRKKESSS